MSPAAKAREPGQASFTTYMADENWRALRREADEEDVTRSSILEALYELHRAGGPINPDLVWDRAREITQGRRKRAD